jgi:hypothetical protein
MISKNYEKIDSRLIVTSTATEYILSDIATLAYSACPKKAVSAAASANF